MSGKVQKIAAHGFIKRGNKYLVLHRSSTNDYMPGKWDLPGGTVEFGEDPILTLKREIKEETSLSIKNPKLLYLFSFISNLTRHQLQIVYECDYLKGKVKVDPEDHDAFKWLTVDEIGSIDMIAFLKSFYNNYANIHKKRG